jgi:hypothetical protein
MSHLDPIAYTYEADTHCPACAIARFGTEDGRPWPPEDAEDREGNPVGAVFPWDDEPDGLYCGTCHGTIAEPWEDEPEDEPEPVRRTVASDVFETLPDGTYRHQSVAYREPDPFVICPIGTIRGDDVVWPRSHASWCRSGYPCHPDRRDDR